MQYLLSHEEFSALSSRPTQKKVSEMATAMEFMRKELMVLSSSQCVYEKGSQMDYCDSCILNSIAEQHMPKQENGIDWLCSKPKRWSK